MDKISETIEYLEFIKKLLNQQLFKNIVYNYVFASNEKFNIHFDIKELKQEIKPKLRDNPNEYLKSDLLDIYNLCIENLELFKQLQEIGNSEAKHEVCYYTYKENRFWFTSNINENQLKEFSNVSKHSNTTLWDFCYNVMKLTENKEVNQPITESQPKEATQPITVNQLIIVNQPKETSQPKEVNQPKTESNPKRNKAKGQPVKPVNNELTIKDIVYDDDYYQLIEYLEAKQPIDNYQYKNLFNEMKVKKYTLPEFYNISLEQMKIIIMNTFHKKVSINSLKGNKINNIFKEMPKAKDKIIIQ